MGSGEWEGFAAQLSFDTLNFRAIPDIERAKSRFLLAFIEERKAKIYLSLLQLDSPTIPFPLFSKVQKKE